SGSGLQVDPAQAAALDSAVTEFAASQQPSGDPNEFTAEWQRQFRGRWDGYAPHDESFLQDFLHQWSQAAANWTAQHAGELQQGGNAAFGDHILQTMRQQAHGSDAEMALSFLTSTLQTALTNTRAVKDLQSQATQFASDHWYLVVALAGGALGYGLQQGLGNDNWSPMARISGLAGQLPMFKVFDSGDFQLRLGLTSSSPIPGEAQDVPTIGIAPGMSATGDLGHGWRAGLGANTNLRIAPDVQQLMAQFNLQPSISYSRRVGDAQVDLSFSGAVGIGSGPVQGEGRFQLSISFGHSSRDD
ncbi:MAG: hypothetical protein KC620_19065, partial [Myxococcales bacterium]|nr:hypothetical protein [Myxococcales bacterium]